MRAFLLSVCLLFSSINLLSAKADTSLNITVKAGAWTIAHSVKPGETVFMLARRYHVPPAILADANGISYQTSLQESSIVSIPLGAYNLQTEKPINLADARSLYYKVLPDENLNRISKQAGVTQRTLVMWNNLPEPYVNPGQKILVGWLLYDGTQINSGTTAYQKPTVTYITVPPANKPKLDTGTTATSIIDTAGTEPAPLPETLQDVFMEQTNQEQNIIWEKGSAGFFSMTTKAAGASIYAFHNKAAKGSVIRVKNMNNGRVIFVKVLGPLPITKQFYNTIIGLSGSAKAALGVRDQKAFCELSYAGY